MGQKDFKTRHMRSVVEDSDGNKTVHHIKQVGPSSFCPDDNPPETGYCDSCGVEIDPRHFQELLDKLSEAGMTIVSLRKKLAVYEPDPIDAKVTLSTEKYYSGEY